ncbi:MAG: hypothetical protein HPY66_0230 [Firmicutes bacterium]|nr:hypothetical protein [Bacillota bacterium]MDI6704653.1 EscU/YscU/HrcU family type III secretion system export apparatus switch protein [Bacillota bacterium]
MRKKRIAAAIKYEKTNKAPVLTALGEGRIADKIVEIATRAGVPLYNDEELAYKLKEVDTGSEIPPELYEIIAEILSFVYFLDRKEGEDKYGL